MARCLEPEETPFAGRRRGRRKRSKAVVLPHDVLATFLTMRDPEASSAGKADDLPVTEKGAEHDLELHRVRWDPADRDLGMFDHAHEFDRRLRGSRGQHVPGSTRGRALWRRIPENSSVDATTSPQSGLSVGAVSSVMSAAVCRPITSSIATRSRGSTTARLTQ